MKRNLTRWLVGLQIVSVALTGCAPTQPFFYGARGDLAHYIDRVQRIEYPDLDKEPLPEVSQSMEPLSLDNQNYEYVDLTLEEAISYALSNVQVIKALPGTQRQNADIASILLASPVAQLSTVFDPAIVANTTNSQPLALDGNGNRVLARGASRANQVGGVEDALSEFDAQVSAFLSYNSTDRARNVGVNADGTSSNIFNPTPFLADDGNAQLAISKRIATGGVATARSQTVYSSNNIQPGIARAVPTDYTQIFEAQVQHPLMRGRGTLMNRIPIVLARINEDVALVDYEERIRNLVREVEFAYWDLYAAYWNFETARTARDSSALAYKIARAKFNQGNAANGVAQAAATYHDFEAQFKAALAGSGPAEPGLLGRERNIRLLLGWAATDGRLIRPIDKPSVGLAKFDWESVKSEILTRNLDLRKMKWSIKQRQLELISAKNQILPEVNLSLTYRWVGVGGQLFGDGNSPSFPLGGSAGAFEELFGGNYQEGAARLDFIPTAFGSRRQLTDISRAQMDLVRSHRILEAKEESAVSLAQDYWLKLNGIHDQMTSFFQAYQENDRLVQIFQTKFEMGDSSNQDFIIDNLLRASQQRARAGLNYNLRVAEYNKYMVELHALKGSLLEYNNIMLEEGLWADKAYWDAHERARERDAARFMDYGASRPKVVSRGEFQQFTGDANSQAQSAIRTIPPKSSTPPAETVPAEPNQKEEIPLERRAGRVGSGVRS
jgi:outer membrane protein TolC